MAVQAQYPSNVLLNNNNNNNRNGQEMKNNNTDYSLLQTQPNGGLMLDQSQMFFHNHNNGGVNGRNNNPRKRGREVCFNGNGNGNGNGSSTTTTSTAAPINLFSLQPQPPTLINLSQLHNQQQQQPHLGLRLAFNEQQNQQQTTLLSEDLTCQIKQQRDEIDQFLQLQGDQLRRTLAERRQTHYRALLGVAEESASKRLREKETEVQRAVRRNAELEERVAQLRIEAQAWQNKARTQEATAAALQVQLQQAMMMSAPDKREEGVGCSGGAGAGAGEADDAESAHIDPERVVCSGPGCKACREGAASVVLLPCRHLSLCTSCNATVDTCPVCLTYKTASVEVYLP